MTTSRFGRTTRRRFVASSALGGAGILTAGQLLPVGHHASAPAVLAQDSSADVPMFRGNAARTGVMPGPGPDDSNGVEELWRFATDGGPIRSDPAVVDGVVYVGSRGRGAALFALNAEDGVERWRFAPGDDWYESPAVVDGVVYVGSGDTGSLYALNADDGTERWRYFVGYGASSPAVVDGVVYIGSSDGNIHAVNAEDGTERWLYKSSGEQTVGAPAVVDGMLYVAGGDNRLRAVDAEDGTEHWQVLVGSSGRTPAVFDGVVYLVAGTILALDAENGTERWEILGDQSADTPAVVDTVVYANVDGGFCALNAKDGTELWRLPYASFSPAVADETVYVYGAGAGIYDANLHALNNKDGTERWRFPVRSEGAEVGPVVVGGVVYVGSYNNGGLLLAIGARS